MNAIARIVLPVLLASPGLAQVESYLVDSNLDQLFSVDLSWKASTGELWTIDLSGGEDGTIDTTTGTFTAVYQTNLSGWQGMAWDETTQKFYLANQSDDNYELDPVTGTTTLIGAHGAGVVFAKGFDLVDFPCSGRILRRGAGCLDASNTVLTMAFNGIPCIGQQFSMEAQGGTQVPFVLVMGVSDSVWLGGIVLPVDLTPFGAPNCSLYVSQDLVIGPFAPATQLTLTIPNQAFLAGGTTFWQGFVIDGTIPNPLPLAASDYLAVTIGQ